MILKIIEDSLTPNPYSRPQFPLKEVKTITLHWTSVPNQSAKIVRDYFESRKNGKDKYGSTQYIVGLKGEVIQCIPDNEVSFHCGSTQVDPKSGKIYTDYSRAKFGNFYCSKESSPNSCTIGIETCIIDNHGTYNKETWEAMKELVAMLLKKHNLTTNDIDTHEKIVGWKFCPKLFHDHPEEFDRFVKEVGGI